MKHITKALTEQLVANGRAQRAAMDNGDDALDFKPVVKLFTPDVQCTWLLTELDPDDGRPSASAISAWAGRNSAT